MPPKIRRKRKIAAKRNDDIENNNNTNNTSGTINSNGISLLNSPMHNIMKNAQFSETFHNKYIKELQQLYMKMDHEPFMFTFTKMLQSAMTSDESNDYGHIALLFFSKYVTSYNTEITHPVLVSTFKWLLSTTSTNAHIRYRLCQFVNMVLNALGIEAALDDCICDKIMSYMIERLRDIKPNVRVQAILALQRLQVPDNPDDLIVKTYQFHLSSDPSPRVRQAVISSMGRNFNTIPYILERLWDIDEKVRRHTYLHMSSYPARAYKVAQRLTLLEQGLNDRSEMVRKVVTTVMLPQWLESYNKNFILLISGLKLDANESEIDRFRKTTKLMLKEIFKRQKVEDLIETLRLETEGELKKCIPLEKITVENTLYWLCLIEYLENQSSDEIDTIIPELSTFCNYITKYCTEASKSNMDKWQKMEYQYILLTLMEIIYTFDLGDEIGRENLKQLITILLKNYDIEQHTVEVIVKCTENLITSNEERLQFFVDIIKEITESNTWRANDLTMDRTFIEELLENQPDKSLKLRLSSLKVKILDLEEQEMNFVERKAYVQAQQLADERNLCNDEYINLLKPLLDQISISDNETAKTLLNVFQQPKKVTVETIVKCLQVSFFMISSKKIKSLTPNVCELYKDFIRRHIESNQIIVRDWALKCGASCSLLYEPLSKDVYTELNSQFYKNHNPRLWTTSVECTFELLDKYGLTHFEIEDKQNKSRKPGRQLYNTLEFLDTEEDTSSSNGFGVDLIFMMSHLMDTCDEVTIVRAIVFGFCRLVLHGHINNDDIMEKLLLKYFNPATEPEISQLLGMFLENLISRKKQETLQSCLIPTINTVLSAPYESPLHEIKPETILRFVIDSTRPEFCSAGLNIHNTIALTFMQEMENCLNKNDNNNFVNKELLKSLSKELITLQLTVNDDAPLRNDLKSCCDTLLLRTLETNTAKNIRNFKEYLDGNFRSSTLKTNPDEGSDEEHEDNSEAEAEAEEEITNKDTNVNIENSRRETELNPIQEQNENLNKTSNDKSTTSPTTFGRDNTTSLRYLRKSLNLRQRDKDESPKPAKIRADQNKRNNDNNDDDVSQENEEIVNNTQKSVITSRRRSLDFGNNNLHHENEKNSNEDENILANSTVPNEEEPFCTLIETDEEVDSDNDDSRNISSCSKSIDQNKESETSLSKKNDSKKRPSGNLSMESPSQVIKTSQNKGDLSKTRSGQKVIEKSIDESNSSSPTTNNKRRLPISVSPNSNPGDNFSSTTSTTTTSTSSLIKSKYRRYYNNVNILENLNNQTKSKQTPNKILNKTPIKILNRVSSQNNNDDIQRNEKIIKTPPTKDLRSTTNNHIRTRNSITPSPISIVKKTTTTPTKSICKPSIGGAAGGEGGGGIYSITDSAKKRIITSKKPQLRVKKFSEKVLDDDRHNNKTTRNNTNKIPGRRTRSAENFLVHPRLAGDDGGGVALRGTRSTTKQNYVMNNIITRKRSAIKKLTLTPKEQHKLKTKTKETPSASGAAVSTTTTPSQSSSSTTTSTATTEKVTKVLRATKSRIPVKQKMIRKK